MAKSNLSKFGAGFAAVALATSLVPVTAGSALASDSYWSAPSEAVSVDYTSILKTYGVRAGSAGPDFLGISNTNFDFTAASPSKWKDAQYDQYTAEDLAGIKGAGLAIWATSVNENPNPFYANLMYNAMTGASATPAATTWVANPEESSWGDSNGVASTLANGKGSTINGLEYLPEIIFGANKTTAWGNLDYSETNIYQWAATQSDYNPTFTNNDASNMWTQLYSIEQLSSAAESVKDSSGCLTTRYDGNSTEVGALAYEKSIRGNLLYCASQLDQGNIAKKTVAYLYAIDGDTGYFFVPTADGLVEGADTGEHATAEDASTAGAGYAANNGTINLDYHGVLPFITDTFDSGHEVEGGIVMKVEDIFKSNPACTVGSADTSALKDVDVIIYNSTVNTDLKGTSGGKNSSGVNNTEALNNDNVTAWAKAHGFSGSVLAGDDYGTSSNQGYGKTAATEDGMSPLLYCQRNYTADKIARAAWAFSKVYPELYPNADASYAYWVSNVYHVNIDDVSTVAAYMTNKSSAVAYDADVEAQMESNFATGYEWWNATGKASQTWGSYAYYNGSTRASFYDGNAKSEEPADTIGIFQPSALWDAASFPDVDVSAYYASSAAWCGATGLIQGYPNGNFGVGDTMTRAQLVTTLWRYYEPMEAAAYDSDDTYPKNETDMADVADNAYYTAAANWAVKSGVIDGVDNHDGTRSFAADDEVTFEQLVAIIAKASGQKYEETAATPLQKFNDAGEVSDWATAAMAWAVNNGLVNGYENEDGTRSLAPKANVPRERVATVLVNAIVENNIL